MKGLPGPDNDDITFCHDDITSGSSAAVGSSHHPRDVATIFTRCLTGDEKLLPVPPMWLVVPGKIEVHKQDRDDDLEVLCFC